eukprot:2922285-Prymnesium_polylepis.1
MSLHSDYAARIASPAGVEHAHTAHKHCTRTAHPPTRGYVPTYPDGALRLPACPVVRHVLSHVAKIAGPRSPHLRPRSADRLSFPAQMTRHASSTPAGSDDSRRCNEAAAAGAGRVMRRGRELRLAAVAPAAAYITAAPLGVRAENHGDGGARAGRRV